METDTGSKTYIEHIDCIHKKHLVNQGIVMCNYGDPSKCDECKYKEPKDYEVKSSWASTNKKIKLVCHN